MLRVGNKPRQASALVKVEPVMVELVMVKKGRIRGKNAKRSKIAKLW